MECFASHGLTRGLEINDRKQRLTAGPTKILQSRAIVLKPASAAFETLQKHEARNVNAVACAVLSGLFPHINLFAEDSAPTARVADRDTFQHDEFADAHGDSSG